MCDVVELGTKKRLVIEEKAQRDRIITSIHDSSHMGVNRTVDMITEKYYWPGQTSDIKEYVSMN